MLRHSGDFFLALANVNSTSLSSSDFSFSHLAVLLLVNNIIPSRNVVVAFGFCLSKRSNCAKSRSLIVFVLGTDTTEDFLLSLGLSCSPPGR